MALMLLLSSRGRLPKTPEGVEVLHLPSGAEPLRVFGLGEERSSRSSRAQTVSASSL